MVEVMMAMSILAVGATGIVAVQKTAIWGNVASRHIVTANAVAATWAERLHQDSLLWNTPTDDNDMVWLNQGGPGVWFSPTPVTDFGSNRADVLGRDLYDNLTPTAYCTNLRFDTLIPDEAFRVEVRVHWSKAMQPLDCAVVPTDTQLEQDLFGFVHLTTSVTRQPHQ